MTVSKNDPRIVNFYNFIQGKAKNADGYYIGSTQNEAGLLYVVRGKTTNFIQVWLPRDLLEYANAAAGTSGPRAVGIRVGGFDTVESAAQEILHIFSSTDNLAKFINSSECDFAGYTPSRKKRTVVAKVGFDAALAAARNSLAARKMKPSNVGFIRESIEAHLPFFRTPDDAGNFAVEIAK